MQPYFTYLLIQVLRLISRIFYRFEVNWIGDPPEDPWVDLRVVAVLNHTSLYEWLFAGVVPNRMIHQLAWHGVVPIAEKTAKRQFIGRFYGMIARHVVPITRKRDHTWSEVLGRIEKDAMVILLPEGRMKRSTGLDLHGRPMTLRRGIADVIHSSQPGRFLIAYSGGLHHVQHPGETFPRLFKTIRMNLENIDLVKYRQEWLEKAGEEGFRDAIKRDLERRRDLHCPEEESITPKKPAPPTDSRGDQQDEP
ncbi:MAG: 1-acyl-sn-glycerol-3-phosphate acyltransferase [Deltaproteobacteria bacterium]|nr:1-acyl-sn-glycerol-3-phosphate acyltransferase [Deltaproteobacteria bacterium]